MSSTGLAQICAEYSNKHDFHTNPPVGDDTYPFLVNSYLNLFFAPKQSGPPYPSEDVTFPGLDEKKASFIMLNFFVHGIKCWIDFVKNNMFTLKTHREIQEGFLEKYHDMMTGKALTARIVQFMGGKKIADDLPHHPQLYLFSVLKKVANCPIFQEANYVLAQSFLEIQSKCHAADGC